MEYAIPQDGSGKPYPLFGINAELAYWIWDGLQDAQSFVSCALRRAKKYQGADGIRALQDRLLVVLGGNLGHEFQAAEEFMYEHWHAHEELGPYPCPYLLNRLQAERVFYAGYRDHVAHQLKVYFLGLYLYDKCTPVRNAIDRELQPQLGKSDLGVRDPEWSMTVGRKEFCLRWGAAALAHDVGYILENDRTKPCSPEMQAHWKEVSAQLEELFARPLVGVLEAWRGAERAVADKRKPSRNDANALSEDVHKLIVNRILGQVLVGANPLNALIPCPTNGSDKLEHECWELAEEWASRAGLPSTTREVKGFLERYYRFAYNNGDREQIQFLDHGVTSSRILVQAWRRYREFLGAAGRFTAGAKSGKASKGNAIGGETWDKLAKTLKQLDDGNRIKAAAAAIAIHNIDPSRFAGAAPQLLAKQAAVQFEGDCATPLAFLLRLADTLQNWDRPRYRPLKSGEALIESKEFSLRVDPQSGKILLAFRNDFDDPVSNPWPATNDDSEFKKAQEELMRSLGEASVERLIDFDGVFTSKGKPDPKRTKETIRPYILITLPGEASGGKAKSKRTKASPLDQTITEEERQLIRERIRVIVKDGKDPTVGECPRINGQDAGCEVIWQAAYLAADSSEVHRANFCGKEVLKHLWQLRTLIPRLLDRWSKADKQHGDSKWINRCRVSWEGISDAVRQICQELEEFEPPATRRLRKQPPFAFFQRLEPADPHARFAEEFSAALREIWKAPPCTPGNTIRNVTKHHASLETLRRHLNMAIDRVGDALRSRTAGVKNKLSSNFPYRLNHEEMGARLYRRIQEFPHHREEFPVWPVAAGNKGEGK